MLLVLGATQSSLTAVVIVAVVGVAGTLLAPVITQVFEGRRMTAQHNLDVDDDQRTWTRERRVDLYVQTTVVYQDALRIHEDTDSLFRDQASVRARIEAMTEEFVRLKAAGSPDEFSEVDARQTREQPALDAKREELAAEMEVLNARRSDNMKRLLTQLMALQVVGSRKVQTLSQEVFDDIGEAGRFVGQVDRPAELAPKDLWAKWGQLHDAMREDLQIRD